MNVWKYEKAHILTYRMIGLAVLFFLLSCMIIGRLFYLQVLQGEKYMLLAEKNRISIRLTMPSRGNIYDRNGVILAENAKTFQAVLVKEEADDYKATLARFLKLIPLDEDEVKRIQTELKFKRSFVPIRLKDNLTQEEMILIQLNMPDLSGVQLEEGMMRYYPAGVGNTHVVGYNSVQNVAKIDKANLMQYIVPQDLKSFGLIPELIGRLPVLTYLNPLDRKALERILTEPKNSIVRQYEKLFEMDGIKLTFTQDALQVMVDKAIEYKLCARGLRSIVESVMMDMMFDAPSMKYKRFEVTADYVKSQLEKSHLQKLAS